MNPTAQPNNDHHDNIGNTDQLVEFDSIDRSLPVSLTEAERLQLGEEMCQAQAKAEQAERDKKAADDQYKGIIEGAYADVSEYAHRLRYGKKDIPVQCQIKRDYRIGFIRITRMDDGTEVESRPMTSAERQMGMKFPDEKGNGKSKAN